MKLSVVFASIALLSEIVNAAPALHLAEGAVQALSLETTSAKATKTTSTKKASTSIKTTSTSSRATSTVSSKIAASSSSSSIAATKATITDIADSGYATHNGGTTGGKGGTITTVSTLAEFSAVADSSKNDDTTPLIIVISGTITGDIQVRIGSNKSIIGLPGAKFSGVGLYIWKQTNVIVRNIKSEYVLAANGDGLTIQASSNVWVDHCEFYSDLNHDKDYYDGLVDITHASEWVTVSNTFMHDHWKADLIGHSDNNAAEDTGHLHVTEHNNYWLNIGSRTPSLRYGTGHIYNSYFQNMNTGIDSRDGAQILVQSNVFVNVTEPITALYSDATGYVNAFDNQLGIGNNSAPVGTMTPTSVPYSYSLLGSANVYTNVVGKAGATLIF